MWEKKSESLFRLHGNKIIKNVHAYKFTYIKLCRLLNIRKVNGRYLWTVLWHIWSVVLYTGGCRFPPQTKRQRKKGCDGGTHPALSCLTLQWFLPQLHANKFIYQMLNYSSHMTSLLSCSTNNKLISIIMPPIITAQTAYYYISRVKQII